MSNYLSRLNRGSGCTPNYSLLIADCSFPQGYVNPHIRGSIGVEFLPGETSPIFTCINPPIRGSIDERDYQSYDDAQSYQSPYKGFNS